MSPAGVEPSSTPGAGEYLPGLPGVLEMPEGDPTAAVVLVPGGSWRAANPEGFIPLGADLADAGFAALTITYGTDTTGAHYPRPLDDVRCAVGYAAQQVPGVPVVVVGHSAGANLALLAALQPDRADEACPNPHQPVAGAVGLAGPYDVQRTAIGGYLFGVPQDEDPELWADGNPHTWAGERPDLPVLLVHGEADHEVPLFFTEDMAAELRAGGHPVDVLVQPGLGHNDVFRSESLLAPLVAWLEDEVVDRRGSG